MRTIIRSKKIKRIALTYKRLQKKLLKALVPEVYYGTLYIGCFNFSQECENYFLIAKTTNLNQTLFITIFFKKQNVILLALILVKN